MLITPITSTSGSIEKVSQCTPTVMRMTTAIPICSALGTGALIVEALGMEPRKQAKEGSRLLPTGECWCGCGAETPIGSFFAAGHDKIAESAVILTGYGGVPEFLVAHGFGPNGRNAHAELDDWRRTGRRAR